MNDLPPLGPSRRSPGTPSAATLSAVKATARRRLARVGLVIGSGVSTAALVGAVAIASSGSGEKVSRVAATPSVSDMRASSRDLQDKLFECLRAKGVTVKENTDGNGYSLGYKPPHEGDPELDDVRYACSLELQAKGIPVYVPSPQPGPDISQVVEIRFKPGTYTGAAQRAVNACYQRDGVTPLPSAAPSPPSQRFRFVGNNVAEGHVIFDCLSVIPGVVVVDVPNP